MRKRLAAVIRRGIVAGRLAAADAGLPNDPHYVVRRRLAALDSSIRMRSLSVRAFDRARERVVGQRTRPMTDAERTALRDTIRRTYPEVYAHVY